MFYFASLYRCDEFHKFNDAALDICDNSDICDSALRRCNLSSIDTSRDDGCSVLCNNLQNLRRLPETCRTDIAGKCVSLQLDKGDSE